MDRTKHAKVLSILEKRALRYRNTPVNDDREARRSDSIDETGTVDTEGLTDDESAGSAPSDFGLTPMQKEFLEAAGVSDELLRVHGIAPGSKQDGILRLIYENLNGLNSRMSDNEKLEKAREIIDDLEADIVCYNEHRLNLRHKQNRNGFSQLFRGGEAEIRTVAAHNVHESKEAGRVQEGGTAMLLYGPLIEQYDAEESGKDDTGLGRLVIMTFRGANGLRTRVVCGYNPCYNNKQHSKTSYQQQRRYFITKENDLSCPRTRFREDLVALLTKWRLEGDRLVVCLDANEDIYRKSIGKALTDPSGLNMSEVVGTFTGERLGATYFRGSRPIDGIWATQDLTITGACVMPAGFGVGDHRLFVVDIQMASVIGNNPPKIVRAASRRLNTKMPHVAEKYNRELERLIVEHRLNSRMVEVANHPDTETVRRGMNAIDGEGKQYMKHCEKKCRKIKSGRIPFSPESSVWIRRKQVYESLLRYKEGKIRNRSNLRRSAQRCGIKRPLQLARAEIKERLLVCEERCEYFRKHGYRYRKRHLKRCLAAARAKNNRVAEQKILDIIKRERERAFWRRINYAMSKRSGRSVRMVQVEMEDGTVKEASGQDAVEQAIFDEIHGKRFYLAEQAPICKGKLRGDFGYMANTPAASAALAGQYEFPVDCHEGTKDLIQEAARIRSIIPENSVDLYLDTVAWRSKWNSSDERTSSSASGLHFGHHIAGAKSDLIARHHSLKSSICLSRGFALERWGTGLSCMLEKLAGCCIITKLRAILLMEADFNANNKLIFGNRMMDNARKHGLMVEEIYSEAGKTAEDGALAKELFYNIVRQCRLTAAISSIDAANCYDSIAHAIASLIFQACGVPLEGIESMLEAIQEMKYFLRTGFGDSTNFKTSTVEVKFQGLCQGNGASPAGWAVISIAIVGAHKRKGYSATLRCPMTNKVTKLAAVLFVDDCDLLHVAMDCDDGVAETFNKMQSSLLNWGNLIIGSGGSSKPIKCFYSLISFTWDRKGAWRYENNHEREEFQMVVPLPDGSHKAIEHVPVTEPKETLGVFTCPNGNPAGALGKMKSKAQDWIDRAKEGKLTRRDIWFMLDVSFWPGVGYGLCVNTAEHDLLESCLKKQYWQLIPLGGVIRTAPASTRQLSKGFYGLGCPHPGIECLVGQLSKIIMHYGCPSNLGAKFHISYNQLVIELGLSLQPLQESFQRFHKLVAWGWLVSLWEKCELYNIRVEMYDVPLKMPWERDKWLMWEFVLLGYNLQELIWLNQVRCHQQVLFLSCIVGPTGRSLDERYLRKRRPGEEWSSLRFPKEKPPPSAFRLWNHAIRQIVPPEGLAVNLGRRLHEGYKKWDWRVCTEEQYLVHYTGRGRMDVFEPNGNTRRRWVKTHDGVDEEILGRPCSVRESTANAVSILATAAAPDEVELPETLFDVLREWGCTWIWKSLRLVGDDGWILDSIAAGTLAAVTDGSYIREMYPNLCSCAFILECSEGRGRIFGSFAEGSTVACAYRGELMGLMAIHLLLLAANKLRPALAGQATIYSDCLGALTKVSHLPANRLPSGCKHSDILKNIMINCSDLSFDVIYLHVEAHQDDKKDYHELERPSQLNCCMDINAKGEIWGMEGSEVPPQEVFPLEPVAVFVGREKLTSGSDDITRFWCHRILARKVFAEPKVGVMTGDQFDEVYWQAVYKALHDVPRLFQVWAAKQVLDIAGTNVMQAKYTPNHDKRCPSCGEVDETCAHVLMCEEAGRVDLLHQSIELVDAWMKDNGTDTRMRTCLIRYAHGRGGVTMQEVVGDRTGQYQRLAASMDLIGWRRFMEGMISVEVIAIQRRAMGDDESKLTLEKWGAGLVTRLLETTHGQWLYRNVHVHDMVAGDLASKRKEELRKLLEDQIETGGIGLEEEDMYLLDINLGDLETSTGEDLRYWLLALRAARAAYLLRRGLTDSGVSQDESGI